MRAGRVQKDISGAHNAQAVDVSSGDAAFPAGVRGFTVGGAGDVVVDYVGGATGITLGARQAGIDYAHQISKIHQTGTTATGIVVFW